MRNQLALAAAAAAGLAGSASAQPGDRTAIVYGARLAGDPDWHFGSLSVESGINAPLTLEIATFFYRSEGVGLSTCVYKTYIDTLGSNAVNIVEDPSNGVFTSGVDGRVGFFNDGAQIQRAFTNRHSSIPGSGFRISSHSDAADAGAPGGISISQAAPIVAPGIPNFNYVTADGVLGFRFNVVAIPLAFPSEQDIHIFTPLSRVNAFSVDLYIDDIGTKSILSQVQIDPIDIHVSWVPSPGLSALLLYGAHAVTRRRRRDALARPAVV